MSVQADRVFDALGQIDSRYIDEAENYRKTPLRIMLPRTAAAVLCIVVIAGIIAKLNSLPSIPVYENAQYSASQIAAVFEPNKSYDATNAYSKVYAPNLDALQIQSVPNSETIAVYTNRPIVKPLETTEFSAFIDRILPRLEASLGETLPAYEIQVDDQESHAKTNTLFSSLSNTKVDISQSTGKASIQYPGAESANHFVRIISDSNGSLVLDGKAVEISLQMSDEEILRALAPIQESLFTIFGERFDTAEISKIYDAYAEEPVRQITVRLYKQSWLPAYADHIEIHFFNNKDGDVLQASNISYRSYRFSTEDKITELSQTRLLSLDEAEVFLRNGYVFGMHMCPLCMACQPGVDFSDYDAVGFEYVTGRDQIIPFYTFYKEIACAKNGVRTYAKTYVCAIEAKDLTEYFEAQKKDHK